MNKLEIKISIVQIIAFVAFIASGLFVCKFLPNKLVNLNIYILIGVYAANCLVQFLSLMFIANKKLKSFVYFLVIVLSTVVVNLISYYKLHTISRTHETLHLNLYQIVIINVGLIIVFITSLRSGNQNSSDDQNVQIDPTNRLHIKHHSDDQISKNQNDHAVIEGDTKINKEDSKKANATIFKIKSLDNSEETIFKESSLNSLLDLYDKEDEPIQLKVDSAKSESIVDKMSKVEKADDVLTSLNDTVQTNETIEETKPAENSKLQNFLDKPKPPLRKTLIAKKTKSNVNKVEDKVSQDKEIFDFPTNTQDLNLNSKNSNYETSSQDIANQADRTNFNNDITQSIEAHTQSNDDNVINSILNEISHTSGDSLTDTTQLQNDLQSYEPSTEQNHSEHSSISDSMTEQPELNDLQSYEAGLERAQLKVSIANDTVTEQPELNDLQSYEAGLERAQLEVSIANDTVTEQPEFNDLQSYEAGLERAQLEVSIANDTVTEQPELNDLQSYEAGLEHTPSDKINSQTQDITNYDIQDSSKLLQNDTIQTESNIRNEIELTTQDVLNLLDNNTDLDRVINMSNDIQAQENRVNENIVFSNRSVNMTNINNSIPNSSNIENPKEITENKGPKISKVKNIDLDNLIVNEILTDNSEYLANENDLSNSDSFKNEIESKSLNFDNVSDIDSIIMSIDDIIAAEDLVLNSDINNSDASINDDAVITSEDLQPIELLQTISQQVEAAKEVITEEPKVEATKEVITEEPKVEAVQEVIKEEAKVEAVQEVITEEPKVEAVQEVIKDEPKVEAVQEVIKDEPKVETAKEVIKDEPKVEAVHEVIKEEAKVEVVQEVIKDEPKVEAVQEVIKDELKVEAVQEVIKDEPKVEAVQEVIKEEAKVETVQEVIKEEAKVEAVQEVIKEEAKVEAVHEVIKEEAKGSEALKSDDPILNTMTDETVNNNSGKPSSLLGFKPQTKITQRVKAFFHKAKPASQPITTEQTEDKVISDEIVTQEPVEIDLSKVEKQGNVISKEVWNQSIDDAFDQLVPKSAMKEVSSIETDDTVSNTDNAQSQISQDVLINNQNTQDVDDLKKRELELEAKYKAREQELERLLQEKERLLLEKLQAESKEKINSELESQIKDVTKTDINIDIHDDSKIASNISDNSIDDIEQEIKKREQAFEQELLAKKLELQSKVQEVEPVINVDEVTINELDNLINMVNSNLKIGFQEDEAIQPTDAAFEPLIEAESAEENLETIGKVEKFSDTLQNLPAIESTNMPDIEKLKKVSKQDETLSPKSKFSLKELLKANQEQTEVIEEPKDEESSDENKPKIDEKIQHQLNLEEFENIITESRQVVHKIIKDENIRPINAKKSIITKKVLTQARGEGLQEILQYINEISGVTGSLIFGHDGNVMASNIDLEDYKLMTTAVLSMGLVGNNNVFTNNSELGNLKQLVFITDTSIIILINLAIGVFGIFTKIDYALVDNVFAQMEQVIGID